MTSLARVSLTGALFLFALVRFEAADAQPRAKMAADAGALDRGKYIVESVAMCARCHTPNNQAGEGDRSNWLKGGPLQIRATYPVANWAVITPRLAGGPPNTDDEFIRLMTTGIARTGAPPRPPMPTFHMTRADAEAVLAYLKSLKN
jgi:mono/diheme cytochrome c family protein